MPLNAEPFPPGPSPGHFAAVGHCTPVLGCCCHEAHFFLKSGALCFHLFPPQYGSQFHGLCLFSQASLTRENFKSYLAASSFSIYFVWCKFWLQKYFVQIFCVQRYCFSPHAARPGPRPPRPWPRLPHNGVGHQGTQQHLRQRSRPPPPRHRPPHPKVLGRKGGGRLALALSLHGGSGRCCSRCWSFTDWLQGFHSRADLAKC